MRQITEHLKLAVYLKIRCLSFDVGLDDIGTGCQREMGCKRLLGSALSCFCFKFLFPEREVSDSVFTVWAHACLVVS